MRCVLYILRFLSYYLLKIFFFFCDNFSNFSWRIHERSSNARFINKCSFEPDLINESVDPFNDLLMKWIDPVLSWLNDPAVVVNNPLERQINQWIMTVLSVRCTHKAIVWIQKNWNVAHEVDIWVTFMILLWYFCIFVLKAQVHIKFVVYNWSDHYIIHLFSHRRKKVRRVWNDMVVSKRWFFVFFYGCIILSSLMTVSRSPTQKSQSQV